MNCITKSNFKLAASSRESTARRGGMTLFEILLVLVLLVVVGSLAMPLLEGGFASIRLRRGTDQVLASWTEARIQAVQTGETHQFLFQTETGLYRVEPWQAGVEPGTDPLDVVPVANDATKPLWLPYESQLPEEILFVEGDGLAVEGANGRTVEALNQGSSPAWSAPILFFPDGTTSSASLLLRNERQLYQRITLRALTGVARASEVLTRDEVEQLKGR